MRHTTKVGLTRRDALGLLAVCVLFALGCGDENTSGNGSQSGLPTQGLVAFYPFSGSPDDQTASANHGTVHDAILTTDRFGSSSSAYAFDGVDDYISVPLSLSLQTDPVTIAAWVKVSQLGWDWIDVVCYGDNGHVLAVEETGFALGGLQYTSSTTCEFTGYTDISDDAWHLLAMTRDTQDTVRIYVDARLERSQLCTEQVRYANDSVYIGAEGPYNEEFNGVIDDVRIYSRPLARSELAALLAEDGWQTP